MKLSIKSICEAINGKAYNILGYIDFKGVSIDSRQDLSGKIFIPLKGETYDGHNFLRQAYEKGALLFSEEDIELPHIKVNCTWEALKDLARYYLSLFNITVIGITGSVGKTTTKDLVASVLSERFNTVKNQGNFNNEIGMPLTIFNITEETEVLVLEMGMNNLGEIHRLASIAKPNIAIITNIGEAHIEFLGSKENIKKAKIEILDFNPEHIILNGDDPMLQNIRNADYYYLKNATNIKHNGILGSTAILNLNGKSFEIEIPIPGDYMLSNALVAAKVGFLLGLSTQEIQNGIYKFESSSDRMKIYKKGKITIINDSYNSSPSSAKAVLEFFSTLEGYKIAILGDMFELGEFAPHYHEEIGKFASNIVDELYAIGDLAKYYGGIYFRTKEDFLASDIFEQLKSKEAFILLKASRGMKFEKLSDLFLTHV